ncbi:MAG: CueP family metal-binding protein [Acidipropionibacterium jensenii]|nr:CueP family metal-binding protein [Acidipropionibacterium jensenii]
MLDKGRASTFRRCLLTVLPPSKEIDVKRAAIAAAALALTLTGCSAADPEPTADGTVSQDKFLTTHGLAAMDAVEIIDHLDRQKVTERPTDLIASVRADELLLSSDDQEVVVDLPDNQTYVSIAPYLTSTHDCFYHSLTTCLGELDNEDIQVTITDEATGEVLVDEATTTFDNGFIGFWLPDDATGLIEVSYQGRTGTTEFSTTDDGATCVTDLRLT